MLSFRMGGMYFSLKTKFVRNAFLQCSQLVFYVKTIGPEDECPSRP